MMTRHIHFRASSGARAFVAVLGLAAGCSAQAQAGCDYDLYIYQPARGAEIYALAGSGGAAALEVAGCGNVRLLPEARAVVARLDGLRRRHQNLNLVTVEGRGSRTEIGGCPDRDDAPDEDRNDKDNMVLVRGASAAQLRRTIGTINAAPRAVREEMIAAAGLRRCIARR